MKEYLDYEEYLTQQHKKVMGFSGNIIIFGTLAMGQIAKKTLEQMGKKVTCFCDNTISESNRIIDGINTMLPKEAYKIFPEALIIIASFSNKNTLIIDKQLKEIGFKNIISKDMVLLNYQTDIIKRPINKSDLANTLHLIKENKGFIIESISFKITQKCTLKCKDCGALIPYFNEQHDYNKELIINSIKRLAEAVDAIQTIDLVGGEPFLYNDLLEVCKEVAKIKNVERIQLVTNGTFIPKDLEKLKKYVTFIRISDYGELSVKKEELAEKCRDIGICIEKTEENVLWVDYGEIEKHNRTESELQSIFKNCYHSKNWNTVVNGEYHFCARSGIGSVLGKVPKLKQDYVDLLDYTLSIEELRDKLKNFLEDTKMITACDYCNSHLARTIKAAIQKK